MIKVLSLMNFKDNYLVNPRDLLFQNELNWVFSKTGIHPSDALFVSYAYKGTNYAAFFKDVKDIFAKAGISLIDINSGDPAALIAAAKMIVIGGGDITTLITKLDSLITATFNPYTAIKSRIDAGIPCIGWNQGSIIVSPKYFAPPSASLLSAINASPFQIICGYRNDATSDAVIKNFLLTNTSIKKAIGQPDTLKDEGTSVRLEETGGGMIDSGTAPYPDIIRYKIVGGELIKS